MASTFPPSSLNEPLSAPPPGETPNFAHPPSRASAVYIAAGICVPLILLFAALRLYAKLAIMKNKKSWDDCEYCGHLLNEWTPVNLYVLVTCILGVVRKPCLLNYDRANTNSAGWAKFYCPYRRRY